MFLFIIGTRPELIKVAPLILELKRREVTSYLLINTGQHRELMDMYWKVFGIIPDYNLDVILPNQDLSSLTVRAIEQINSLLRKIIVERGKPRFIISQGDTTTVLASSIVSFYQGIDFVHIEAGLRSFDLLQPYPEEFNRRIASISAKIHFAPTELARQNLMNENISGDRIRVVGNTGIDALLTVANSKMVVNLLFKDNRINEILNSANRIVLVTCHRRENQNDNLLSIIEAITLLARKYIDYWFIWPLHANPKVKGVVLSSNISLQKNVILTEPLDYIEIVKILSRASKVITDSGGLQEEAPTFKIPVLILRDKTERPEAVSAGYSKLVGSMVASIVNSFDNFNPDFHKDFKNPYGDGFASRRIIDTLLNI